MTIRKTARWQTSLDERILEHLREDSWATPRYIACREGVHATEYQVRERRRVFADTDLVAFLTDHCDLVELTSLGEEYLAGAVDVSLHPTPGIRGDLKDDHIHWRKIWIDVTKGNLHGILLSGGSMTGL